MTTLQDAKHAALLAGLGVTEGHVNDMELLWLQALGATSGNIVDAWWEVFDAAAIPPGQFNDRAVAYIVSVAGAPPSDDYNEHWRHYWLNATLGPPPPPAFANVLHWFDFTDGASVFSDQAGTLPSVPGGAIRHVVNKGLDGTPATAGDGDATTVTFLDSGIVVGGVERSIGQSVDSLHSLNLSHALPGGASGAAFAMLVRANQAMAAVRTIFTWGGMGANMVGNAGGPSPNPWNFSISGGGFIASAKPVVADEWVAILVSKDGGTQDYFSRVSGTPELNSSPSPYSPVTFPGPGMVIFSTGNDTVEMGELIIWDRALTLPERDAVDAYFDAKYGTLPLLGLPSTVAELIHYYDLTDNATVFRNTAGTQLAGEGDPVRLLVDKGNQPANLQSAGGGDQAPIYKQNFVGGQNVGEFAPSANNRSLLGTDGPGLATSTTGISAALVFQIDQAIGGAVTVAAWGSAPNGFRGGREFGAGQFGWDMPGASSVFSLTPHVVGGWYLWYVSRPGGVGTAYYQKSGEVQQSALLGAMLDILAGQSIGLTHITSQDFRIGEWAVWDGPLSLVELTELVDYADQKYGTLPILPPAAPPFAANLTHWWDFTDAATVWADTAGVVAITDGTTIQRVDDKGLAGDDLQDAASSITWHAGIVNGLSVARSPSTQAGSRFTSQALGTVVGGANGITIATFNRYTAAPVGLTKQFQIDNGPSNVSFETSFGTWSEEHQLAGTTVSNKAVVVNEWIWMYMSDGTGVLFRHQIGTAGAAKVDLPQSYQIQAGTPVEIAASQFQGEIGEILVYNRDLTAAEQTQLTAYFDAKYGVAPF